MLGKRPRDDAQTKVAIVGFGAIARIVLAKLRKEDPEQRRVRIVGVLVRAPKIAETRAALECLVANASPCIVTSSVAELLTADANLVVECAGQGAVRDYGEELLLARDLMIISTGALADDAVRSSLVAAAERAGTRMLLPAGAIAGLDGLGALKVGGLSRVTYTSTKPPAAWRGTPAEEQFDLDSLTGRTVVFSGSAAAAARLFPKNANLAATVALAGLGLERTQIQLVADPAASNNVGRIEAESDEFGTLTVECNNAPAADNPKTSASTGLSLVYALLRDGASPIVI
jgi:aspartate dehydrogenase